MGRSPLATTGVQAPSWGWELPRGACSGRWWVALGAAHGLRHSKGLRLQLEPRTRDVTTIRTQWPLAHPFIQTQATQSFCRTTRNALRCFWCALSRPPRPIPEAAPGPPPAPSWCRLHGRPWLQQEAQQRAVPGCEGHGLRDGEGRDEMTTCLLGEVRSEDTRSSPPRPYSSQQKLTDERKNQPPAPRPAAHRDTPAPYLEHEDSHVGHGQVDLGALPVGSLVKPDAVHLQLPGHLQHLEIRLRGGLAPVTKDSGITAPPPAPLRERGSGPGKSRQRGCWVRGAGPLLPATVPMASTTAATPALWGPLPSGRGCFLGSLKAQPRLCSQRDEGGACRTVGTGSSASPRSPSDTAAR